ncbi:hypothetical protein GCM10028793_64600 [Nocardiopsis oceani]
MGDEEEEVGECGEGACFVWVGGGHGGSLPVGVVSSFLFWGVVVGGCGGGGSPVWGGGVVTWGDFWAGFGVLGACGVGVVVGLGGYSVQLADRDFPCLATTCDDRVCVA